MLESVLVGGDGAAGAVGFDLFVGAVRDPLRLARDLLFTRKDRRRSCPGREEHLLLSIRLDLPRTLGPRHFRRILTHPHGLGAILSLEVAVRELAVQVLLDMRHLVS